MTPFIFGAGTDTPTYKDLQRRRAIVEALNEQATSRTPRNVGEGIAAIGNALAGYMANKAVGKKEDAERERVSGIYDALVGNGQGGFSGGVPTGGSARDAIASIESAGSGDYSAKGPVTKSGDRAYGRYQVMGANIPDWSKEALGVALTPEQFLVDPKAQDAVFDHRFGGYTAKYGPEGAARAWFSGEGGMNNPNASDGNLTNDQYAARFNSAMGGMGGMSSAVEAMNPTQMSQLAELAANPYLDDGKRMVVQALLQQSIAGMTPQQPMTPYQQAQIALNQERLGLDRAKFEADQAGGGGGTEFGLTPIPGTDADGNPVFIQPGKDGTINVMDLPEGFTPTPGVQKVDVGTGTALVNTKTGETLGVIPKDDRTPEREKAIGKAEGETIGDARVNLPYKRQSFDEVSSRVDAIVNDKALDELQGKFNQYKPDWWLSQEAVDVRAKIEQLGGDAFMEARQALKGGGQITDYEGQKAEQALARMQRAQSAEELRAGLREFQAHMKRGLGLLESIAAQGVPAQPAIPNDPDAALFEKYGLQ